MLIDSHCHLDRISTEDCGSTDEVLARARAAGVEQFLCIATNLESFERVKGISEQHQDVFCTIGIHPLQENLPETEFEQLVAGADHERVVAIGETGLDYYYAPEQAEWQQQSLRTHIEAAKAVNKPLIIHTRDAREDTLNIFKEQQAEQVGGVLHCFTESKEMAFAAIDMGFYISFSGILTFKSANSLREVAKALPQDRILVETDSPWLAPVPHRGQTNQPVYVKQVAQFLADLRGESFETVSEYTTNNFYQLFPEAKQLIRRAG
jgi:TatD DNase family protein